MSIQPDSWIREMAHEHGALFIVDTRREHIAVKEARKLGVPTIALIDTDSDPDLIDLPIPGNDDAMRAVEIICHELAEAAIEGKAGRVDKGEGESAQPQQPRRRSSRSTFRAEEPKSEAVAAADAAPTEAAEAQPAGEGATPVEAAPPPAPTEQSHTETVAAQP